LTRPSTDYGSNNQDSSYGSMSSPSAERPTDTHAGNDNSNNSEFIYSVHDAI
jgi:hypothetical protein